MCHRSVFRLKSFVSISAILLLLNYASPVSNKQYLRCELARELMDKYKINKTFLSNCKYSEKLEFQNNRKRNFVYMKYLNSGCICYKLNI